MRAAVSWLICRLKKEIGTDQQPTRPAANFLQVADVKQTADFVAQLRRIGRDGHGVWSFDHELHEDEVRYMAYAGESGHGRVGDVGGNGA